MTVWVLLVSMYDESDVVGVFSSKEGAEAVKLGLSALAIPHIGFFITKRVLNKYLTRDQWWKN